MGWSRRNDLVPVPHVKNITELNELLLKRCNNYENHHIKGKADKVGIMYQTERSLLHKLPGYKFETAKSQNVRVNAFSTVRFKTNSYSVPVQYTGRTAGVKGYPETVQVSIKDN